MISLTPTPTASRQYTCSRSRYTSPTCEYGLHVSHRTSALVLPLPWKQSTSPVRKACRPSGTLQDIATDDHANHRCIGCSSDCGVVTARFFWSRPGAARRRDDAVDPACATRRVESMATDMRLVTLTAPVCCRSTAPCFRPHVVPAG